MQAKLDEIRRLRELGYSLEEVESDGGAMEVHMRRGGHLVSIRFLPDEARALLSAGPLHL